jgi:hypothetical protein
VLFVFESGGLRSNPAVESPKQRKSSALQKLTRGAQLAPDATEMTHGGASVTHRKFATVSEKSREFANFPELTAVDTLRFDRLTSPRRGIRT